MKKRFFLLALFGTTLFWAQHPDDVRFDRMMQELSNTERWGAQDQQGTLNYITSEIILRALALPKKGETISLSRKLDTVKSAVNRNPLEHRFSKGDRWKGDVFNSDYIGVSYHGSTHSHLDGLTHITHKGKMYNNTPVAYVTSKGAERLGVEHYKDGIVSRALLFDLPLLYDVDYLPSGTAITTADLLAFEARFGITITQGDIVLIRTGRWKELKAQGPWEPFERTSGLHYTAVRLLHDRKAALLGSDGINDVFPSGIPSEPAPVHKLTLVAMGMPLLDNLDLDKLAAVAAAHQQWEFLISINPLYVSGGTGSPVNPVVIF